MFTDLGVTIGRQSPMRCIFGSAIYERDKVNKKTDAMFRRSHLDIAISPAFYSSASGSASAGRKKKKKRGRERERERERETS